MSDEELRAIFLEELSRALATAMESKAALRRTPTDIQAQLALKNFFHRIAGSAASVDFPVLGRLCAVCEGVANLVLDGKLEPRAALRLWDEGLAGAREALEQG